MWLPIKTDTMGAVVLRVYGMNSFANTIFEGFFAEQILLPQE